MSDSNTPDQGATPTSNLGGKRTAGQRGAPAQKARDSNIRKIKELWGVSELNHIFPSNIRPAGDLGDSAINNLRCIATKMPNLGASRALMVAECVDTSGRPSALSFKNTVNILNQLKGCEKMVNEEEKALKEKKPTPEKEKKMEEAAKKKKMSGKVPVPAVSKEQSRHAHRSASKSSPVPGSASASSKESAAVKTATKSKTVAAKNILQDESPILTPVSKIGISLDTPAVVKFGQHREPAIGLHVPNRKDVAPFSKTLANTKGAISKKAAIEEDASKKSLDNGARKDLHNKHFSLRKYDESTGDAIRDEFGVDCEDLFETEPQSPGLMTDERGIPTEPRNRNSRIPSKRPNEDTEVMTYGGLPFTKESILAELNFKKRVVEKDGYATPVPTPSDAETEIDIESVPKLLRDNVAIEFGFKEANEALTAKKKADDAKAALAMAIEANARAVAENAEPAYVQALDVEIYETGAKALEIRAKASAAAKVKAAGAKAVAAYVKGPSKAKPVENKVAEAKDNVLEEKAVKAKVANGKTTTEGKPTKGMPAKGTAVEKNVEELKTMKPLGMKTEGVKATQNTTLVKKSESTKTCQKKVAELKTDITKASQNKMTEKSKGGKNTSDATEHGYKKRKLSAFEEEGGMQTSVHLDEAVEKRPIKKPVSIHPKLDVPYTTHFDKPSKSIASLFADKEKANASKPQTPTSPTNSESPIPEIYECDPARPFSETQDFTPSGNTAALSPARQQHTFPKPSKDNSAAPTNLTSKTGRKSTVPEKNTTMERSIDNVREKKAEQSASKSGFVEGQKDIHEYSFSELVELARAKAAKSTKAGKHGATGLKDPMDYTIRELRDYLEEQQPKKKEVFSTGGFPATGLLAGNYSTPASTTTSGLPTLPETLVARVHADRVLITSIPGIVKAYVEELRARVADGEGPSGDLLSMIIVNKYGYFLENVECLEKDLKSLYYETLDRNP